MQKTRAAFAVAQLCLAAMIFMRPGAGGNESPFQSAFGKPWHVAAKEVNDLASEPPYGAILIVGQV